jgi:uncharacterized protein YabE (DUF348 family)
MPVPGKFEHRSTVQKRSLIGVVSIAVAGTLGLSGAAYATFDKAVTVSVDGKTRTVHTFGSTVADVLRSANIRVSERDLVAPNPQAPIRDGSRVAVRYARPLTLMVDGRKSTHWVTALSVGEALNDLGLRYAGARMSVSRSVGLGRKGLSVDVHTRKRVVIRHDGRRTAISAPVLTVREALRAAGVSVDGNDRVSPRPSVRLADGTTIIVKRVAVRTRTVTVTIPYETIRSYDSSMYEGESRVERAGEPGTKAKVLRITFVDGKPTQTTVISQRVLSKPVAKRVVVGTKKRPVESVGGSVDSLNWAALAECESGGNPQAVNPAGYYGLYQFSLPTWRSVGGTGNPIDHSASEQTYRAKLLYQREGDSPWPVCGSRLYS